MYEFTIVQGTDLLQTLQNKMNILAVERYFLNKFTAVPDHSGPIYVAVMCRVMEKQP